MYFFFVHVHVCVCMCMCVCVCVCICVCVFMWFACACASVIVCTWFVPHWLHLKWQCFFFFFYIQEFCPSVLDIPPQVSNWCLNIVWVAPIPWNLSISKYTSICRTLTGSHDYNMFSVVFCLADGLGEVLGFTKFLRTRVLYKDAVFETFRKNTGCHVIYSVWFLYGPDKNRRNIKCLWVMSPPPHKLFMCFTF